MSTIALGADDNRQVLIVPVKANYSIEDASKRLSPLVKKMGRVRHTRLLRIELKPGITRKSLEKIAALGVAVEGDEHAMNSVSGLEKMVEEARLRRKESEDFDAYGARQYFLHRRAFPNDSIDYSAYRRAVTHRSKMPPTTISRGGLTIQGTGPTWEFLGPKNFQTLYGPGPVSGRVTAVAYDPVTPTTFYVCSAGGGLWKTTNSGQTYVPLSDAWPTISTNAIAVNPSNPSILYVGTGDFDGWMGIGNGVMKSTDGGSTWTTLGREHGFHNFAVSKILLDPANPSTILVALGRGEAYWGGVWRSTDGGATWSNVIDTPGVWSDLAVSQPSAGVRNFFAVSTNGLLYRSINNGTSWAPISSPLLEGNFIELNRVACSPTVPGNVYLTSPRDGRIYRSTNFGNSWSDVTGDFPATTSDGRSSWDQGWWDSSLTISSGTGGDVIYVGQIDLLRSSNAGVNWRSLAYIADDARMHPDQHAMAFHPQNPNQALAVGDGGVFRYNWNPTTDAWSFTPLNATLGITQEYAISIHPTNPNITLGGSQDNSTSYTNGDLNTYIAVGGGDGGFSAINFNNPSIQYATSQFCRVVRTNDNWATEFEIIGESGNSQFIAPLVMDPNDPNILYTGTVTLKRYDAATNSWFQLIPWLLSDRISAIAIAHGSGARMYFGTLRRQVHMSQDGAISWTLIDRNFPSRAVTSISVNPTNPNDILVGLSGTGSAHLLRCLDVTAPNPIWTSVDGSGVSALPDVSLNAIARDPYDPLRVWHVATDMGVFSTYDFGATWTNSTAPLGLPNVRCDDIKSRASDGALYVGTHGRGIWRIYLPPSTIVKSLSIAPTTATGGGSATGTVMLHQPAATGGVAVNLSSNNPAAVVPPTVNVPAGASTTTFPITVTNSTYSSIVATITQTLASEPSHSATLKIQPNNRAAFISQSVPTSMIAGQSYPVNLVFRNAGGVTWDTAHGYQLFSANPYNNSNWGMNRMPLSSATVPPSAQGTFAATVIAPNIAGTYNFQWQPYQQPENMIFGQASVVVPVIVTKAADAAFFVSKTGALSVNAGADFTISNTMKNVGTNAWANSSGYSMMTINPVDDPKWLATRAFLPSNATVSPNAQGTFSALCTAPTTPGTYTMQWQCNRNGTPFGDKSPVININVVAGPDNAQYVSQVNLPSGVAPSGSFAATFTMKNVGAATWNSTYSFVPVGSTSWGNSGIVSSTVAPNGNGTFTATFTAPPNPGTYTFQRRMAHSGTKFGQLTPPVSIVVSSDFADNAAFVSQIIPLKVSPGSNFTAKVTMLNSGPTTWTQAAGYCMLSQNPTNNTTWGTNRLIVPSSATVSPNTQVVCSNVLRAPITLGTYTMQWRMARNSSVFGAPTASVTILVEPSGDDAVYVGQTHFSNVVAGSTFLAKVTMRNTGTTTWTQAAGYCLLSQNPAGNTVWGTNRLIIPSGATVAPGTQIICSNTLKAPTTPGTYTMQWRMSRNGFLFGGQTFAMSIVVTAPPSNPSLARQQRPVVLAIADRPRFPGTGSWR